VIFPTETVYGLGADFGNKKALERLKEVKRRSEDKPFSVMIDKPTKILHLTSYNNPALYKLINKFWPGPLTVIVPAKDSQGTWGIRVPDHAVALRLVAHSQCLLAAPSANVEGQPSPTSCQEALKDLDGLVDVALDAGSCRLGVPSTIVDFTVGTPTVSREGSVSGQEVHRIIKTKTILFVCTGNSCRSVMAEYLLKKVLGPKEDVEILSAGTGVFLRSSASAETMEILKKEGMDASAHESRSVTDLLLKKADLILVMTRQHRQQVLEIAPEIEKRVYLLKEFAHLPKGSESDLDIPDPIGKPSDVYEGCLSVIKEAIQRIVKII